MPCPHELPPKVKSCVKQVMAKDPSLTEVQAIKICRKQIGEEAPINLRKAFVSTSPVPFEIVKDATPDGEMILRGYATTDALDLDNDIIEVGAVAKAFELYRQAPTIRLMHLPAPIGLMDLDKSFIDKKGAFVEATLFNDPDIPEALKARALVRSGGLRAYSIAGAVLEVSPFKLKNGQRARRVSGLHIAEISLVDTPSNRETFFTAIGKSADNGILEMGEMYPPEWLRSLGLYPTYAYSEEEMGKTTREKQTEDNQLCQMKMRVNLLKELQKI